MSHTLRRVAVRTIKPLVSDRTWQRLKARGGAPAGQVLTPQQERRRRLRQMDLTELAQEFGTDKWGTHRYTPHYQRHLEHLRDEPFTLLEIGIGGYRRKGQGGASLRMWKHFFRRAQILGLDIQDKSFVDAPRIRTYKGSQTDADLLRKIVADAGGLQVVIDDGSHRPEHIRETFKVLFPLLHDGGVYAIEDTQTSYWPEWGGSEDRHDPTTTMALVKDLLDGLNFEEYVDESYEPTYTDLHVKSVHCYHNLVVIEKGDNREGTNRRQVLRARYEGAPAGS
jgi:demethylmacrocin O-methyltransferase